jgi:hypothetical protein
MNLDEHAASFKPSPAIFKPRSDNHVEEFLDSVLAFRTSALAPSTFSDVLYNLAKIAQPGSSEVLQCAENVFAVYEEQILDSFDRFRKIAENMRYKSQVAILQNPSTPGNVANVPYSRLYAIFMRGNSPFIAMAKLFVNMDMTSEALSVLERGYSYRSFAPAQISHVFGASASDPLLESKLAKFTEPRKELETTIV